MRGSISSAFSMRKVRGWIRRAARKIWAVLELLRPPTTNRTSTREASRAASSPARGRRAADRVVDRELPGPVDQGGDHPGKTAGVHGRFGQHGPRGPAGKRPGAGGGRDDEPPAAAPAEKPFRLRMLRIADDDDLPAFPGPGLRCAAGSSGRSGRWRRRPGSSSGPGAPEPPAGRRGSDDDRSGFNGVGGRNRADARLSRSAMMPGLWIRSPGKRARFVRLTAPGDVQSSLDSITESALFGNDDFHSFKKSE